MPHELRAVLSFTKGMIIMENHVYIMNTDVLHNKELFQYYYKIMPEDRKKKIDEFRFEKDKQLSLGAGILLITSLKKNGVNNVELQYNQYDKPFLAGKEDIYFNISHSGKMVVCAISDRPIGVDIEEKQHFENDVIKNIYNENEIIYISKYYADKDCGYTELWTIKESIMKYYGSGLSLDPIGIYVNMCRPLKALCKNYHTEGLHFTEYNINGYALTVCSEYNQFTNDYEIVDPIIISI